jgi:hypothetical protein
LIKSHQVLSCSLDPLSVFISRSTRLETVQLDFFGGYAQDALETLDDLLLTIFNSRILRTISLKWLPTLFLASICKKIRIASTIQTLILTFLEPFRARSLLSRVLDSLLANPSIEEVELSVGRGFIEQTDEKSVPQVVNEKTDMKLRLSALKFRQLDIRGLCILPNTSMDHSTLRVPPHSDLYLFSLIGEDVYVSDKTSVDYRYHRYRCEKDLRVILHLCRLFCLSKPSVVVKWNVPFEIISAIVFEYSIDVQNWSFSELRLLDTVLFDRRSIGEICAIAVDRGLSFSADNLLFVCRKYLVDDL